MTRRMLSKRISDKLGISQRYVDRVLVRTFATIAQRLSQHDPVELRDFGTFEIRRRKGRQGRHPATGRQVLIRGGFAVRFKPGKRMQQRIRNWPEKPAP